MFLGIDLLFRCLGCLLQLSNVCTLVSLPVSPRQTSSHGNFECYVIGFLFQQISEHLVISCARYQAVSQTFGSRYDAEFAFTCQMLQRCDVIADRFTNMSRSIVKLVSRTNADFSGFVCFCNQSTITEYFTSASFGVAGTNKSLSSWYVSVDTLPFWFDRQLLRSQGSKSPTVPYKLPGRHHGYTSLLCRSWTTFCPLRPFPSYLSRQKTTPHQSHFVFQHSLSSHTHSSLAWSVTN